MPSIFTLISRTMSHDNCTKCHMEPMSFQTGCTMFIVQLATTKFRAAFFTRVLTFWKIHRRCADGLQVHDCRRFAYTCTTTHELYVCTWRSDCALERWIIDGIRYGIPLVLYDMEMALSDGCDDIRKMPTKRTKKKKRERVLVAAMETIYFRQSTLMVVDGPKRKLN